jgi:hypothetical protein
MDSATAKRVCIAATAFLFCSSLGLRAREKEKPLLRVHEVISNGFAGGTQKRFLEVFQSGRISLKKSFTALLSGRKTNGKGATAILSSEELEALRESLNSPTISNLQDSYADDEFTFDYHGSMEIEMTPDGKTKRIALPDLSFGAAHNSKIYPVSIHDLVCKIYGLEQRVGIPYGRTVAIDPDGHKYDDTWCDAASLDLIPKSAP